MLVVKAPPFFDREYMYEITSAGTSLVRATLQHSPKVKKQWTLDDLEILFENGMIRFANEKDLLSKERAGDSAASDSSGSDSAVDD